MKIQTQRLKEDDGKMGEWNLSFTLLSDPTGAPRPQQGTSPAPRRDSKGLDRCKCWNAPTQTRLRDRRFGPGEQTGGESPCRWSISSICN